LSSYNHDTLFFELTSLRLYSVLNDESFFRVVEYEEMVAVGGRGGARGWGEWAVKTEVTKLLFLFWRGGGMEKILVHLLV